MAPKYILAVARLYKGVLIFETVDSFVIYNELGQRIPFHTQGEAEAFVDAWEAAARMFAIFGHRLVPIQ